MMYLLSNLDHQNVKSFFITMRSVMRYKKDAGGAALTLIQTPLIKLDVTSNSGN